MLGSLFKALPPGVMNIRLEKKMCGWVDEEGEGEGRGRENRWEDAAAAETGKICTNLLVLNLLGHVINEVLCQDAREPCMDCLKQTSQPVARTHA